MTHRVPAFYPLDAVLTVLRETYGCDEQVRSHDLIVITCSGNRAVVLTTDPSGVATRTLAGALAVLQIDLQEVLARLDALRRGDGAERS